MPNHDYTPDCRVCAAGGRCDAMRQLDIATELNNALAQDAANELRAGLLAADAAAEDARTYKAMAEAIVEGCAPTAQGFGGAA